MNIEKKIAKWTDDECLDAFFKLLDRVSISTIFLERKNGLVEKQSLVISCGKEQIVSNPVPMAHPMRLATPKEMGATVN